MPFKYAPLLFITCVIAAFVPLAVPAPAIVAITGFPGWPAEFEGRALQPLPLTAIEHRFATNFPGRIGRFTDGKREIILRWIAQPSRKLHPAADCFRGSGYSIKPLPIAITSDTAWGSFEARRGPQRLLIREAIVDDHGGRWTDVSSWYWSAIRDETTGPWLAITVAEVSLF